MKELKDNEKELIEEGLVVIDFFGTWCGPCMVLKPTIEKLATEYSEKGVMIYGCDVDECPEITSEFGIRNIPTLILLKNGEIQNRLVGTHPEETIREAINLLISENT